MREHLYRALVLCACICACATLGITTRWSSYVRTADQNGDGKPDIWRTYNRQGQLSKVSLDTNFDGRADVQEYYERGSLVRRESDRDFNDRVDLVQEFDPTTREPLRSVVDVDFDGSADLLVLFSGGKPVFSKWAHPAGRIVATALTTSRANPRTRSAAGLLAPLQDPFRSDLALTAVRTWGDDSDSIGLSTSGGLPASVSVAVGPLPDSSAIHLSSFALPASTALLPYSPRGPPPSLPLA
jgi:hypothetical protein